MRCEIFLTVDTIWSSIYVNKTFHTDPGRGLEWVLSNSFWVNIGAPVQGLQPCEHWQYEVENPLLWGLSCVITECYIVTQNLFFTDQ